MSPTAWHPYDILVANRSVELYWRELVEIKVECEYTRRYRDVLSAWVTRFAVFRAIVSASALGSWAVIRAYPMVWGGIIAAAQVADALQHAIPLAARVRGTSTFVTELDMIVTDCLAEWEDIFAGRLEDAEIIARRHAIMKRRRQAKAKNLPAGLPNTVSIMRLAEQDADDYFKRMFSKSAVQ